MNPCAEQFLEAMRFRHACKEFDSSRRIPETEFEAILEAGRLSPSSFGFEPWKFLVVQSMSLREKMRDVCWGGQGQLPTASHVVVLLSLNQILSMYTLTPETRALAWTLVMIHNGMSIFLWPASFVLPNALRAANDVRFTMVVATASMLVWRMGLSWVLCVQMGMGAVGVWYAMVVDWICRIICFVARFVSGAWKRNAVKKAA